MLVLRTCDENLRSYEGFQWPESGEVAAPDWDPAPQCGGGLHGLPRGEGDGTLLDWSDTARWLVVEVPAEDVVLFSGKCKFPRGRVLMAGTREEATQRVAKEHPNIAVVGLVMAVGYGATVSGGDRAILQLRWFDGNRARIATAYVGENGIKPHAPYVLKEGQFVEKPDALIAESQHDGSTA